MKTLVIEQQDTPVKLPDVGQCWRHSTLKLNVYMRIENSSGQRCLSHDDKCAATAFYSINLQTGIIAHTDRCAKDIQLLEPVDGEVKFRPVS